jgi:hypothetical protein
MRAVAPDDGLVTAYIDYMTNRDGETEAQGRFKNIVDNLTLTAALGGLIKSGAFGLKLGRQVLESPPKVGRGAQAGAVGNPPPPVKE